MIGLIVWALIAAILFIRSQAHVTGWLRQKGISGVPPRKLTSEGMI
jgi:hypothetical protein